jgi:hypothetical protein
MSLPCEIKLFFLDDVKSYIFLFLFLFLLKLGIKSRLR